MINMKRTNTGIEGLDELIEGGFPRLRSILVTGATGTGKTIFSMQYLYNGAKKYNEAGVYLTLDERPDLIREDMLKFGWDIKELEEQGKLQIIDGSITKIGLVNDEEYTTHTTGFNLDKLLLEMMRVIKRLDAKRVVIDSIPALGFNFENEIQVRKAILKLSYMLTRAGVTAILTTEVDEGSKRFGKYGVEEYVADGVIVLHYLGVGTQNNRSLHIRKLRATKHSEELHPLEITSEGIKIKKIEDEIQNL